MEYVFLIIKWISNKLGKGYLQPEETTEELVEELNNHKIGE